jgi:hypothetical protein
MSPCSRNGFGTLGREPIAITIALTETFRERSVRRTDTFSTLTTPPEPHSDALKRGYYPSSVEAGLALRTAGMQARGTVTELTLAKGVTLLSRTAMLHGEGATQGVAMKKRLTMPDEPRNITRADLVITEGFGLEVDGRMKKVFPTLQAAQKRARDLKAEFPMLQVKVYDAAEKKLRELSPIE